MPFDDVYIARSTHFEDSYILAPLNFVSIFAQFLAERQQRPVARASVHFAARTERQNNSSDIVHYTSPCIHRLLYAFPVQLATKLRHVVCDALWVSPRRRHFLATAKQRIADTNLSCITICRRLRQPELCCRFLHQSTF